MPMSNRTWNKNGSSSPGSDVKYLPEYRAVLFDLDGTLLNSFDGIVELFQASLQQLGCMDIPEQAVRRIIGLPLADCFAKFMSADQVDAAVALYREQYVLRMHDISPPFPGAEALLTGLTAQGIQTGVVSNKRGSAVRSILERKGWRLDVIVGEGDGIPAKPEPDMLFSAIETLGVSKADVLYVGDGPLDAGAAAAAGMAFAGVTTGELSVADFAQWPHVGVFHSLPDLATALRCAVNR